MVVCELRLVKDNNVDTFKKIDNIYVDLMRNLHNMLFSSCEQVKLRFSGIKKLTLDYRSWIN